MRFIIAMAFAAAATTARGGDTVSEASFLAAAEGLARAHARRGRGERRGDARPGRPAREPAARGRSRAARRQPAPDHVVSLAWSPPLDGRRGLSIDAADAGLRAAQARPTPTASPCGVACARLRGVGARRGARERLRRRAASVRAGAVKARRRADAGEESGLAARSVELAAPSSRPSWRGRRPRSLRAGAAVRA